MDTGIDTESRETATPTSLRGRSRSRAGECSERLVGNLCDLIEKTQLPPWERDYVMLPGAMRPQNPATGHRFTGQNRLMLLTHLLNGNLGDPRFLTFRQALELGKETGEEIAVRKGERGILLLRPVRIGGATRTEAASGDPEDRTLADLLAEAHTTDGEDEPARVYMTAYTVFHASQITNMPSAAGTVRSLRTDGQTQIDAFLAASGIELRGGALCPAYDPRSDQIAVPEPGQYASREAYYSTLLHEFYHATGSSGREGRSVVEQIEQGKHLDWHDPARAAEELRADFFAATAMTLAGMQPYLENRAAYLDAWRQHASDPDVRKALASAALETLPMLDAFDAYLHGAEPELAWWGGAAASMTQPAEPLRVPSLRPV